MVLGQWFSKLSPLCSACAQASDLSVPEAQCFQGWAPGPASRQSFDNDSGGMTSQLNQRLGRICAAQFRHWNEDPRCHCGLKLLARAGYWIRLVGRSIQLQMGERGGHPHR